MKKEINHGDNLKRNGLKNTKHRIAVLEILEHSDQPISAEQVFSELIAKKVMINLSTVYRVLDCLVSKNLAIKINISGNNKALFEYNHMVHKHYLVCLECKKIEAIECCPLKTYVESLEKEMDYTIAGHKLNIYGYCPKCKAKANKDE